MAVIKPQQVKKNWKTSLGGAISIMGTSLIGIGTLTQLTQLSPTTNVPPKLLTLMWYVAAGGFILSAIGKGITSLFAADASTVSDVVSRVNTVAQAVDTINQTGTSITAKPVAQNQPADPPKTP